MSRRRRDLPPVSSLSLCPCRCPSPFPFRPHRQYPSSSSFLTWFGSLGSGGCLSPSARALRGASPFQSGFQSPPFRPCGLAYLTRVKILFPIHSYRLIPYTPPSSRGLLRLASPLTHLTHDPFHHIVPLDTVTLFPSRTWCAVSGAVHFRSCFPPFVVALLPPPSERSGSAYLYFCLSTERCSAGNATVSPQRGSSRRMPVNRPPRQRERLTVTLPPDALGQVTKWYEWLHVLSLCEHFCMHTARWRRPRGGAGFRGVEAKFSLSDRFSWTRRLAYSRAQARLQGGSGRV